MAIKNNSVSRQSQEAAAFVDALRGQSMAGGVFDSAAAREVVQGALHQNSVAMPTKLKQVFDEATEQDVSKISRALLDGANAYQAMHGTQAPGDLLDQAVHLAYSTTKGAQKAVMDAVGSSDFHAATSLQPNRAVVAILSSLSEAIPFAHYLPADIGSNEAKLAIMTHQAGSTYGGYSKGQLMDGVNSGMRFIGTSREHLCELLKDTGIPNGNIAGKITAVQATDDTCDPAAAAVPLLRGRAIVYVNGQIAATENAQGGTISGGVTLAVAHTLSGSIDNDTGEIALLANPPFPLGTEVLVEAFINYEANESLTPRVLTEVETFTLHANPYRVITTQSIDSRTQMTNELGLDPYSEGVIAIQSQFANERHYDVLRKAKRLSTSNQATFDFAWANRGDYKSRSDVWRDLAAVLGSLSQKMANDTMNHGVTHLYVSNFIGAQLHGLPDDIWQPSGVRERAGIYRLGRLFGKYEVYYTPSVVAEAVDGSAGEILCVGQATDVTRNPFILGDAVAPMVVPLSMSADLKQGSAFYARNFTCVNPHKPSAQACARINVTNMI
ncbi:MAG: hypothetical protein ACRCYV_03550 [Aeromonas sp.]